MKNSFFGLIVKRSAYALVGSLCSLAMAQPTNRCKDIAGDVKTAIEKDSSKTLMVVEDALVINESCAVEIVEAAIIASKADAKLADQIVQTAISVAPAKASEVTEASLALVPGLAVALPIDNRPVTVSGKNPDKNALLDSPEPEEETLDSPEPFGPVASIRGVSVPFTISGPLPPRSTPNPVSPSAATP